MHELPITESIRDIALKYAEGAGGHRVTDIYLVIGQFSTVLDESVQFYWDIISKDTITEGAQLHFRRIPAKMKCKACEHTFQPNQRSYDCPKCESERVVVIEGQEFFMEAINIEGADESGDRESEKQKGAQG